MTNTVSPTTARDQADAPEADLAYHFDLDDPLFVVNIGRSAKAKMCRRTTTDQDQTPSDWAIVVTDLDGRALDIVAAGITGSVSYAVVEHALRTADRLCGRRTSNRPRPDATSRQVREGALIVARELGISPAVVETALTEWLHGQLPSRVPSDSPEASVHVPRR